MVQFCIGFVSMVFTNHYVARDHECKEAILHWLQSIICVLKDCFEWIVGSFNGCATKFFCKLQEPFHSHAGGMECLIFDVLNSLISLHWP